jgi:hypothetical protein
MAAAQHLGFIFKQGNHYEPLCKLYKRHKQRHAEMFTFSRHECKELLLRGISEACRIRTPSVSIMDAIVIILINKLGLRVSAYVIGYDFTIHGVLTEPDELFVPLPYQVALHIKHDRKFVYITDIVPRRPISIDKALSVFKALRYNTQLAEYNVMSEIPGPDGKTIALQLFNGAVVPLKKGLETTWGYLDNLNIFVGSSVEDAATNTVKLLRSQQRYMKSLINDVSSFVSNDSKAKNELAFWKSRHNPYPISVRRSAIEKIVLSNAKKILNKVCQGDNVANPYCKSFPKDIGLYLTDVIASSVIKNNSIRTTVEQLAPNEAVFSQDELERANFEQIRSYEIGVMAGDIAAYVDDIIAGIPDASFVEGKLEQVPVVTSIHPKLMVASSTKIIHSANSSELFYDIAVQYGKIIGFDASPSLASIQVVKRTVLENIVASPTSWEDFTMLGAVSPTSLPELVLKPHDMVETEVAFLAGIAGLDIVLLYDQHYVVFTTKTSGYCILIWCNGPRPMIKDARVIVRENSSSWLFPSWQIWGWLNYR